MKFEIPLGLNVHSSQTQGLRVLIFASKRCRPMAWICSRKVTLGTNHRDVEQLLTAAPLSITGCSDKVCDEVSDKGDLPHPQNVETSGADFSLRTLLAERTRALPVIGFAVFAFHPY